MVKTFEEANAYVMSYIPKENGVKFAGQFGLDRQRYLLHLLGDPQNLFPCVHITGTSGKSSTSFLTSLILKEAGYMVGLYISPHLVTPCERIQINNKEISEEEFVELVNAVMPHVESMKISPFGTPTYFEILVTMTFLAFVRHKINIAVIEVGLGGRYDGTNVVTRTLVAVITNVGLDHTQILGCTVEKIIDDKKEIIKSGCVVVSGATQESVRSIIQKKCSETGTSVMFLGTDAKVVDIKQSALNTSFAMSYKEWIGIDVTVGLLGKHQVQNAVCAIMAAYELNKKGFTSTTDHVQRALRHVEFGGRMEVVRTKPLVVLDGAHNEDKMRALMTAFPTCFSYSKLIVILALKKDKDADAILPSVLGVADRIIVTQFTKETDMGNMLCKDPEELATILKAQSGTKEVVIERNPIRAFEQAASSQDDSTALLVTGSLYLVGEMKKALLEKTVLL